MRNVDTTRRTTEIEQAVDLRSDRLVRAQNPLLKVCDELDSIAREDDRGGWEVDRSSLKRLLAIGSALPALLLQEINNEVSGGRWWDISTKKIEQYCEVLLAIRPKVSAEEALPELADALTRVITGPRPSHHRELFNTKLASICHAIGSLAGHQVTPSVAIKTLQAICGVQAELDKAAWGDKSGIYKAHARQLREFRTEFRRMCNEHKDDKKRLGAIKELATKFKVHPSGHCTYGAGLPFEEAAAWAIRRVAGISCPSPRNWDPDALDTFARSLNGL